MKTYLITGGAGFIGSNFIAYMLKKHQDIFLINLDKLTYAGNLENLQAFEHEKRYTFIQGDICDESLITKIFKDYSCDYVVNFAAESHVDRSIVDPNIFAKTNILGTLNLLNISKIFWEKKTDVKFLQVSTDEVYGSLGETGFFTETTPLCPHSPYSASKASADHFVMSYFDTFGLPVNITRCSNNYGPYQFPEKLIPLMFHNAKNSKSLPIYGDGLQVRDWLYVEDHCKAIDMVIQKGICGEVYNIGGHNERTNITIVKQIIQYLGKDESLIQFVEDRKGHDRRYGIDPKKIKDALGWEPDTPFEKGIIKTLHWYEENSAWLKNVTSGEYQNYYKRMYHE
ncbi:MAG: dTDP-glucose 4,6-dehydratase [Treponemataceae bacterium]